MRYMRTGRIWAMYLEGGREAQMFIKFQEHYFEFVGIGEIGFNQKILTTTAMPIPNIIGISAR